MWAGDRSVQVRATRGAYVFCLTLSQVAGLSERTHWHRSRVRIHVFHLVRRRTSQTKYYSKCSSTSSYHPGGEPYASYTRRTVHTAYTPGLSGAPLELRKLLDPAATPGAVLKELTPRPRFRGTLYGYSLRVL